MLELQGTIEALQDKVAKAEAAEAIQTLAATTAQSRAKFLEEGNSQLKEEADNLAIANAKLQVGGLVMEED